VQRLGQEGVSDARQARSFKGNKASLPTKRCVGCGRPMSWRKRWARDWNDVKFCSSACRGRRGGAPLANG
jgi:hypothetical protein